MPDLKSILAAYLVSAGGIHPYGHVAEGSRQGIPVDVNYGALSEHWNNLAGGRRAQTEMNGGGFAMQDQILSAMPRGEDASALAMANAINKLLYMGGASNLGKTKGGDIENMERLSGNKYTNLSLLLSALSDYGRARNPERNWDYSFDVIDGAPGGRFTMRF